MRKFLLLLGVMFLSCMYVFAAKIPAEVVDYINKSVPGTYIRFDGVVIMPDNTVYLPLYPSLFSDITVLKIKKTYPENKSLQQRPDAIIFNNDFVLLKVLTDNNGHRTVLHTSQPPLEIRTGLLPQDMLVPSGLIIPENIKGIIGNLKIDTKNEDIIKHTAKESFEEFLTERDRVQNQELLPQLENKIMFVTTNYSKNIQVVEPAKGSPMYSLSQKSIPIDIECIDNGKFILVTSYERPFLDVISVCDSRFIKQICLDTLPEEIVIDKENNKAYVTAPTSSLIFVIDLKTMSIIQKIKVNGYCEKLLLAEDKIFYIDKLTNDVWAIEPQNEYLLRNIGKFPNISALAYSHGYLYMASRTKSRIAVVNYKDLNFIKEFTTVSKPIALYPYGNVLYVLGAQDNKLSLIDIETNSLIKTIDLGMQGFSTKFNRIDNSDLALITDIKSNTYIIFDLNERKILKTYRLNIPIKDIRITNKVKLFD